MGYWVTLFISDLFLTVTVLRRFEHYLELSTDVLPNYTRIYSIVEERYRMDHLFVRSQLLS